MLMLGLQQADALLHARVVFSQQAQPLRHGDLPAAG